MLLLGKTPAAGKARVGLHAFRDGLSVRRCACIRGVAGQRPSPPTAVCLGLGRPWAFSGCSRGHNGVRGRTHSNQVPASSGNHGYTSGGDGTDGQAPSAQGGPSTSRVFRDITLYVPIHQSDMYMARHLKAVTLQQIQAKVAERGCDMVLQVDAAPRRLLHASEYVVDCELTDGVTFVDELTEDDLCDSMRLALVVDEWRPDLAEEWQNEILEGWRKSRENAGEPRGREWVAQHLRDMGDTGVQPLRVSTLSIRQDGSSMGIGIHGLVYSRQRVGLVEDTSCLTMQRVREVRSKQRMLRRLVEAGAPKTRCLSDACTGEMKPLETFLVADSWPEDPEEAEACKEAMLQHGITPVLAPGLNSPADSFNPSWPPARIDKDMVKRYLDREKAEWLARAKAFSSGDGGCGTPAGPS